MRIGQHDTHPASELFPLEKDEALKALVEDVKTHGLRVPITLFDGRVLDGRNRYLACEAAGVEPRFETWTGDDPVSFVMSQNLHRRHLNESQRSLIAAKAKKFFEEVARQRRLGKLKRGGASPVTAILPERENGEAREKAATLLNVSPRSVQHAARLIEHGSPEAVKAVESGAVKVATASAIVGLSEEKQRELASAGQAAASRKAHDLERRKKATSKRAASEARRELVAPHGGEYACLYLDATAVGDPDRVDDFAVHSFDELASLDIPSLVDPRGAHLWLWATWPMIREGVVARLLKAWGFRWTGEVTWMTDHEERPETATGLPTITQICVLAVHGELDALTQDVNVFVDAPRVLAKPREVRELIERVSPGPRLELFGERKYEGWDLCKGLADPSKPEADESDETDESDQADEADESDEADEADDEADGDESDEADEADGDEADGDEADGDESDES